MDLKNIKELFKKYNLRPSKRLGQNFLIDKKVLRKIIETANLQPNDLVLEIGPGIGNLTQELAKKAKKVIAIEKDPKMAEILKEKLKDFHNVEIITGDALKIPNTKYEIQNMKYKLVANLPYYIVSPVIRKFLELPETRPRLMVLMVQKEVAQRICAKPPDMSLLAVSVQFYAKPKIVSYVSKKSFWPVPKVNGAILKISAFNQRRKSAFNQRFFRIVRAGFSQPRKQIINNLAKMLKLDKEKTKAWLLKNNVQPSQRPETLEIQDWLALAEDLHILSLT